MKHAGNWEGDRWIHVRINEIKIHLRNLDLHRCGNSSKTALHKQNVLVRVYE
jgi:hypothetical protein